MRSTRFGMFGPRILVAGIIFAAAPALMVLAQGMGPTIAPPPPPPPSLSGPATGPSVGGPSIAGPSIAPPPASAPALGTTVKVPDGPTITVNPGTGATTLPSAESVMQGLLKNAPANSAPAQSVDSSVPATPAVEGVAPNQPPIQRMHEGQFIWNRVGRIVKDEKSGQWLFAFESDGTEMQDPPLGLLPCRMLEAMENASEKGTKPVKFKISGQLTEYHNKNYLLVTFMQTVRDLNQF